MFQQSPQRRKVTLLALICLILVLGCWNSGFEPVSVDDPPIDDGATHDENNTEPDAGPEEPDAAVEDTPDIDLTSTLFTFDLPWEGEAIGEPRLMAVSGPGLARVQFTLDGVLKLEDTEAPFEWTLDPTQELLGERRLDVTATGQDNERETQTRTIEVVRAMTAAAILDAIESLPGGFWFEIPNSQLRSVGWYDPDDFRGGLRGVMDYASGGAYDTTRDRLLVFGGGDAYSGNEVYAFDLKTALWMRLTDPTPPDPDNPQNEQGQGAYPDGTPYSRHTYDYLEYIPPPVDRLFSGGGAAIYPGGIYDFRTWYFDEEELTWEVVAENQPAVGLGAVSALGPDGRVWQHDGGNASELAVFDPSTETWSVQAPWPGWFGQRSTAAIDPVRNHFVVVGHESTYVWDLEQPAEGSVELETSGADEIEGVHSPGLDYHPGRGRLVAWGGGPAVYTLELDTGEWERIDSAGDVDPGPPTIRGVYGRFRYVPSRDVFILATSVDKNVFIYRLPELSADN